MEEVAGRGIRVEWVGRFGSYNKIRYLRYNFYGDPKRFEKTSKFSLFIFIPVRVYPERKRHKRPVSAFSSLYGTLA